MKYVVIPNCINDIDSYMKQDIDTFIVGLEDFSINYPSVSLEKIKELSNRCNLFVSINKNIFNSELDNLKDKLLELSKLSIMGVLFYDIGVLNIVLENKINISLVWHQTHMVTNYNTCNYYNSKGVRKAFLANEITLEEILEIKKKTNMELMVEVFGYPIMSHSRRSLLSNYFKSINKEKENRTYELTDKENKYLIKETKDGASILFGKPINGTRPLFDLIENDINYAVLDMQEIPIEIGNKVLETYTYILNHRDTLDEEKKKKIIQNMNELIGDSTNFFYKKTIYKVKKGENNEK